MASGASGLILTFSQSCDASYFSYSLVCLPLFAVAELVPPSLLEKSARIIVLTRHRMIKRICF